MTIIQRATHRAGNALVIALSFSVLVAGLIAASSTSSTRVLQDTSRRTTSLKARAAVEAVLQRYEARVIAAAQTGELLTWTGDAGQAPNFGRDFFGDCEVRWKIEPCRTPRKQDVGAASVIPYMTNPSPSSTYVPDDADGEQQNDYIFLYRVAAEARVPSANPAEAYSIAQGVRYVGINEQPLFRYVIFYAQRGAKGDIEFSHGPEMNINGNVHSNGAIYLGASTKVNNWGSVNPDGVNGDTVFGPNPTGGNVFVEGLDGIFRVSKPMMYSGFDNHLNSATGGIPSAGLSGTPRSGSVAVSASYDLTTAKHPNETVPPVLTDIGTATNGGRVINPYRLLNKAPFITGPDSGSDTKRRVNGKAVVGDPTGNTGNDSRDLARSAADKFAVKAPQAPPTGWGGFLRTSTTGANYIKIPKELTGGIQTDLNSLRPFEAQAVNYVDSDSDPTTDNHESARPLFATTAAPSETIPATGAIRENPGLFMTYALLGGTGDVAMERLASGRGWTVTTATGAALPDPQRPGLVIRERPIPQVDIWPGTASGVTIVDPSSPSFMPYAYGKHWRPSAWPFTAIDVTDDMNSNQNGWSRINLASANRQETYQAGGRTTIKTAQAPGLNYPGGRDSGSSPFTYRRYDYFYDENWRFVHLRRPVGTATAGVRGYYFNDTRPHGDPLGNNENLRGVANVVRVDATVNLGNGGYALPSGINADNYSVRWESFLTPTTSGNYTLSVKADDQARVWLNGRLLINQTAYASNAFQYSPPISLQAGQGYSLVVEFREDAGGDNCNLYWTVPGGSSPVLIPAGNLTLPDDAANTFAKSTFTAIQARIDTASIVGPDQLKVGLMVREHQGLSPLSNGRNPYVAMLFSPKRGFFSQERLQPSNAVQGLAADPQYFVGRATYGSGSTEGLNGQIPVLPDAVGTTRIATVTVPSTWPPIPPNPTTSSWTSDNGTSSGETNPGEFWITLGDGSAAQRVRFGPVTKTRQVTPTTYANQSVIVSGTFPLDLGTDSPRRFISDDVGRTLRLYSATTGTVSPGSFTIGAVLLNGTAVSQTWTATSPTASNAAATASASVTYGKNDASDVTIWSSGVKRADGSTMSNAELVAWLTANRDSGWGVGSGTFRDGVSAQTITGTSGGLSWTASIGATNSVPGSSTRPVFTIPAYPAAPATITPTVSVPALPAGANLTFSVDRSRDKDVAFDLHSYIPANATWFTPSTSAWSSGTPGTVAMLANQASTNVSAFLPWNTNWNALPGQAASAQVIPPFTGSFRPDVWSAATAPVNGSTPSSTTDAGAGNGLSIITVSRWGADQPTIWNPASIPAHVWVRIEKTVDTSVTPNRVLLRTLYYTGATAPANAASFTTLKNADGSVSTADITGFADQLQIGLCAQSGAQNTPVEVAFTDISVQTSAGTINATQWDAAGGASNATGRYLASQYQVFWGNREITEDFFNYSNAVSAAVVASEDWIYNTREFWSQNKRWNNGTVKDSGTNGDGSENIANRLLWAKTTLLSINLAELQTYLKTRNLSDALRLPFTNPALIPTVSDNYLLSSRFNGLVFAARTNRYPWNPNTAGGRNPYAPSQSIDLPNGSDNGVRLGYHTSSASATMSAAGSINGFHNLQPYDENILPVAEPIKPQDFHHGVRLFNGSTVDWGYTFPQNLTTNTPAMTQSRTSIVTPNQLFLHGDLNTATNTLYYQGSFKTGKITPLAVMGDTVTLLSNAFQIEQYQNADIKVRTAGTLISGTSPLAIANGLPAATTTYNACIVTNNQPTTRQSVREGQGAPVIDTLMYQENWTSRSMNYRGSLVVMDSRRYTQAFLLDENKSYGRTMMGTLGWSTGTPEWTGSAPMCYGAPSRTMTFNDDLLTEEGTPPFAPFGVTAAGIGGWVRTIR